MSFEINIDRADVAILISALSLCLATTSLAWNVFRELWLRPRLKVSIDVVTVTSEVLLPEKKIMISGTNFGPGKIRVGMIWWRKTSIGSRLRRASRQGVLIHDYKNPMNGNLPVTLDVGERVDLMFSVEDDGVLSIRPTKVGLRDNFGRDHWAPKKALKKAQADYDRLASQRKSK